MKKQFFYAVMAFAMMASCTSEDNLSVDPITPEADDKVAIELGVDAPTVSTTVGGRSVGSVGDIADAQNTAPANRKNVWNGEQLYIAMVDKATGNLAKEKVDGTETDVLSPTNYVYYAPRRSENSNSGSIRMYKEANKPATNNGDGTRSYVYYPVSGQYDFYGWHLDDAGKTVDAEGEPTVVAPTVTITKDAKTVKNIIINGQQDIMGAKTKEFTEANYFGQGSGVTASYADMVGWDFSARTARNKINPILKFEHQLARLKFFVKAGSDKTAEYKYVEGNWVKNQSTETTAQPTAMKVKSIKVLKMIDVIDMNLEGTDANGKPAVVTTSTDTESATFTLGSRGNDGIMTDLVATAPKYFCTVENPTAPTDADYADHANGTQVGESVMFFPGTESSKTVELEVELAQLVQTLDGEANDATDLWEEKTQTAKLKVHASSLINQTDGAAKAFEPGKSYNVYITIYGFERIEITAELTAWENGGDVNVDVEEGESRHDVDVQFNVLDENGDALTPTSISATYSYKNNAGETVTNQTAEFDGTKTTVPSFAVLNYTITADDYENATGYVNARNGQEVTITMKPTGTTPAPTSFDVTFNVTLNGEVVSHPGLEVSTEGCEVNHNVVTVPAGVTSITYSIPETATYYAVQPTTVEVSEGCEPINVVLSPKEVRTVTFLVKDSQGADLSNAEISFMESYTAEGYIVNDVPVGATLTYTASLYGYKNASGTYTVTGESNEVTITLENAERKTVTFKVLDINGDDITENVTFSLQGEEGEAVEVASIEVYENELISGSIKQGETEIVHVHVNASAADEQGVITFKATENGYELQGDNNVGGGIGNNGGE